MSQCHQFEQKLYEGDSTPETLEHVIDCSNCSALQRRLELMGSHLKFEIELNPHYESFRKDLIRQKTVYVSQEKAVSTFPFRLARVAILVLSLGAAFLFYRQPEQTARTAAPAAAKQVQLDFELSRTGQLVKLQWKGDPHKSYQVYKGPNPASLLPVQRIQGTEWMDKDVNSSPILFYKIEAL